MKKFLVFTVLASVFYLTGCYDASQVEETAYLIALGIDKNESTGFNYTFQFASPTESKEGEEKGKSENQGVKNIVISAPDFYTAKNYITNYLSKNLNMSHMKFIVCSEEFAKNDLKKHSELFLRERQIRPGTFMAVAQDKAEGYLKTVNPDLEGSTSKYYELSNSQNHLNFAPAVRLGDFVSRSEVLDKSTVLPIAVTDKEKNAVALYGMGVFKDGQLNGKMSGEEALLFNVLSGEKKLFNFSTEDKKNKGETLPFKCTVLKTPEFFIDETKDNIKIKTDIFIDLKFVGAENTGGYKNKQEILNQGEIFLKEKLTSFLYSTSRVYNADILRIERFNKSRFTNINAMNKNNFKEKYKKAVFEILIKRSNKGENESFGGLD